MIVGFSLGEINGQSGERSNGSVNVSYAPEITSVEARSVAAVEEKVAAISFDFPISYTQDDEEVGTIEMRGEVLWKGDAEDLEDGWDEDESMPQNVEVSILNHLYQNCLPQAVSIADQIGLPSPVPMPRAKGN